MTRATSARVAGVTFLLYIALGVLSMTLMRGIPEAQGITAILAGMNEHASTVRMTLLLGFLMGVNALVLGVALWGITRDQDAELAMLALCCRVGEGLTMVVPLLSTISLLWLASTSTGGGAASGVDALAGVLLRLEGWNVTIAASLFAVGSTIFCWLMLQGRMVPKFLAAAGLLASVTLVGGLLLRLTEAVGGDYMMWLWGPMGVFEIVLGFWLLLKGVPALPARETMTAVGTT